MGRILLATIAGGVVMFMWGFVSWTVLSWHETSGFQLPDEAAFRMVMQGMEAEDGLYWVPGHPPGTDLRADEVAMADWNARHESGPLAVVVYRSAGKSPEDPMMLVRGFVISLTSVLAAAFMLAMAGRSLASYWMRVSFVTLIGVIIAVYSAGLMWNYMFYPDDFTVIGAIDDIVTWFLVGLVLGGIIKPRGAAGST
jgi:hypothetical protein